MWLLLLLAVVLLQHTYNNQILHITHEHSISSQDGLEAW